MELVQSWPPRDLQHRVNKIDSDIIDEGRPPRTVVSLTLPRGLFGGEICVYRVHLKEILMRVCNFNDNAQCDDEKGEQFHRMFHT